MSRSRIETACEAAISRGDTPGAVVLIGRDDEVVCHVALGHRAVVPEPLPMQLDTVFDLASVTKPLATAPAIMQLVEAGTLGLRDPLAGLLPWADPEGAEAATLRHLLTHTAGLPPWLPYAEKLGRQGRDDTELREAVVADICALPRDSAPGERFVYTCLGYIVLADIVRRVTGKRLDEYCREALWRPLGMSDTGFSPENGLRQRCAATEQLADGVLVGVVHDENARFLDGVGGNAGLFGTAADVSRFCRMMLREGALEGRRVLSGAAVRAMTTAQTALPGGIRGLGWDIDTDYSPSLRGDLFGPRSYGHSGYTGTSVWIDPDTGGYVVLLTNRVHFGRDVSVQRLRYEIANIAAAMITD